MSINMGISKRFHCAFMTGTAVVEDAVKKFALIMLFVQTLA
ncbi:hypothetical protein AB4Z45_04295 [Paenibacillus sp. MCAF9]